MPFGRGHGGAYDPSSLTLPITPARSPRMYPESDHGLRVAGGEIPGQTHINKFGQNPVIDTGTAPEDVWDLGGLYTFSATAVITRLSSSDNGDTEELEIEGLTLDGTLVTQTKTLTGQTQAILDTPLWRVFRMKNLGSTDLAGTVYCYETGTETIGVPDTLADVRAVILGANNQTLMSVYTVPANKAAYLKSLYVSSARSTGGSSVGDMSLRVRESGGVFQVKHTLTFSVSTGVGGSRDFVTPDMIPAMSDILIRVDSVSDNGTIMNAGFSLILVDV